MSEFLARVATALAALFAVASLVLLLQGRVFFAGFVLTLVAFAIYVREINT